MQNNSLKGTLLVALSGVLYGLIGYLGTELFYAHFSVENMLFWRFFIAALWMAATLMWRGHHIVASVRNTPGLLNSILFGALTYSGASAFYFMASKHIGTGLAMVIFFSFPVFVTLFMWLFSDWRMNRYAFFALLAMLIGLLCLRGQGIHGLDVMGIVLAIIAALFYATYLFGSSNRAKNLDTRLLTMLICLGCTAVFLTISLYEHTFTVPGILSAWFYICAIGIVATALPIQLLLDGLKYISPVKASILSALEPVVTILIGLALLNEHVSAMQVFGVMIILSGAILIQFERIHDK